MRDSMMEILQVKLALVLVLLKLVSASIDIDKEQYYKSLTPEQRREIFNTDDIENVPEFELIHFDLPKRQKRSLDRSFSLTLPLKNKNVNLNLKLAAPLIGPNTPLYVFQTINGKVYTDTKKPFQDYSFNIYEDDDKQASLVVDVDDNGNRYVHTGIIGSQNISIHRGPTQQNFQSSPYVVRLINFFLGGGNPPTSIQNPGSVSNLPVTIPDVVYPEILVMFDFSLCELHRNNLNSIRDYILNFWTSVNIKYKSLSNPKYKLSIAGIAIATDESAFPFVESSIWGGYLNFNSALSSLSVFLYNNKKSIPVDSYDVVILHTSIASTDSGATSTIGLAHVASACHTNDFQGVIKAAVVNDDNNYKYVYTATHELAHTLGVDHDDKLGCTSRQYIMSSTSAPNPNGLTWSQCSINGFQRFLRTNPKCLFNVPEPYQKMIQPTTTKRPTTTSTTPKPTTSTTKKPTTSTTSVEPPPEIDVNDNIIDTDSPITKNGDSDDDEKTNDNNRQGKGLPVIPSPKMNEFIPNTNVKYSDLTSFKPSKTYMLTGDFAEIVTDLEGKSNKVMYMQIVDKKYIFIYYLDKIPKNPRITGPATRQDLMGFLVGNRNAVPANPPKTYSWRDSFGNPISITVEKPKDPKSQLLFPDRIPPKYSNPNYSFGINSGNNANNNNGDKIEFGFSWGK